MKQIGFKFVQRDGTTTYIATDDYQQAVEALIHWGMSFNDFRLIAGVFPVPVMVHDGRCLETSFEEIIEVPNDIALAVYDYFKHNIEVSDALLHRTEIFDSEMYDQLNDRINY